MEALAGLCPGYPVSKVGRDTGKTLVRAALVEADKPWASASIFPERQEKRDCCFWSKCLEPS